MWPARLQQSCSERPEGWWIYCCFQFLCLHVECRSTEPARLRAALSSQTDVIRTFPDVIQRPSEQCSQHQRPTQMYLLRKTITAGWKKLFQPQCFSQAGLGDSFFPRCALVKVHRTCKSGRMKGLSHNWIHSMQHLNTSAKGQTLQIHRCCSHSATFTYKSASIIYVWNPLS